LKQWNRLIMLYCARTQKNNNFTTPIIKTWKLTQVTCVSILKCRQESERKWQVLFLTYGTHQNNKKENVFTYENFQVS
jgi:hypothetical protein